MIHRNREVSFQKLRDALVLTDGNLGSHAQKLLDTGYIEQRHALAGLQFELRYRLTSNGERALMLYIHALQDLLPIEDGRHVHRTAAEPPDPANSPLRNG